MFQLDLVARPRLLVRLGQLVRVHLDRLFRLGRQLDLAHQELLVVLTLPGVPGDRAYRHDRRRRQLLWEDDNYDTISCFVSHRGPGRPGNRTKNTY